MTVVCQLIVSKMATSSKLIQEVNTEETCVFATEVHSLIIKVESVKAQNEPQVELIH